MKNKKDLQFLESLIIISDLDWIQTSNLLSRNQVRYSVAPRGRFLVGANIIHLLKNNQTIYFKN
jgi:hypothetical protein